MDDGQFFSMPPGSIIPGRLGKFSIYLKPAGHRFPVLFTRAGQKIDSKVLERLEEMDVREVYIRTDERVNFNQYIENNLQHIGCF